MMMLLNTICVMYIESRMFNVYEGDRKVRFFSDTETSTDFKQIL